MYIAEYNGSCGIGEELTEAYNNLLDNSNRDPDIEDVSFYKAEKIKVEQKIVIVDEKESSNNS